MERNKSVNELLNELVDAQIITEGHKLLILRAVEREKTASREDFLTPQTVNKRRKIRMLYFTNL